MAEAAAAPGGAPPAKESIIPLIVKLIESKGSEGKEQIEKRIASGQPINMRGAPVGVDVLKEALEQYKRKVATASSVTAASGGVGQRFVTSSTSASQAAKAQRDFEYAKPFIAKAVVTSENRVGLLPKPCVHQKGTGEYLAPEQTIDVVARAIVERDGRVYLKVKDMSGWVSTRSRKDFSKFVLTAVKGQQPLEPPQYRARLVSAALNLLPRVTVDDFGRAKQADTKGEPQRFRTVAKCAILKVPGATTAAAAQLNAKDEFVADAACMLPAEGRVYLRLQDGRGWVCERLRNDISRFGVEPCSGFTVNEHDEEEPELEPELEPATGEAQAAAESAAKVAPRIFRSDADLWPEGKPRQPLRPALRKKLYHVAVFFGAKVKECEADIKELDEKIGTFNRACPAQKELKDYVEQLRKEAAKARQAWIKKVEETLKEASEDEKRAEEAPAAEKAPTRELVFPVQVQGRRWYCAMIREGVNGEERGSAKQLGPLRPTASEAAADLERMRKFDLAVGEDAEDGEEGPRKRQRTEGSADAAA